MARIGFKKAKYNPIDKATGEYKTVTGSVPEWRKVTKESFEPEYNEAELYANDALCESDYSFKRGKLAITVDDDEDKFCAELLGNKITDGETDVAGEVTSNSEDSAPEIGYGHIITKVVNGVRKYKVEFFPRVKITSIKSEAQTMGKDLEFMTTDMEGKVFACEEPIGTCIAGDWRKHKTFSDLTKADEYLDSLLTPPKAL